MAVIFAGDTYVENKKTGKRVIISGAKAHQTTIWKIVGYCAETRCYLLDIANTHTPLRFGVTIGEDVLRDVFKELK